MYFNIDDTVSTKNKFKNTKQNVINNLSTGELSNLTKQIQKAVDAEINKTSNKIIMFLERYIKYGKRKTTRNQKNT